MPAAAFAPAPAAPALAPVRHQRRHQLRADFRVLRGLARAALDTDRPLMAHVVVTRRCNLACGYCTEYDAVSPPVPLDEMKARIDRLARLGTVFVTLTGGETLLHPDIVAIVRHVRDRGMTPALNTNGYLLTAARIDALNDAGLYALQLSLDNLTPSAISKKSLKPLRGKLRLLAERARFRVRVNTVFGAAPPAEALAVARAVHALGFDAKCSLARDPSGRPLPVDAAARAIYDEIRALDRHGTSVFSEDFQTDLLDRGQVTWKCRAGARFFTVCEDGLVHLCTPKMGLGAKPLADYGVDDIRAAFATPKPCAATCPVAYAHQGSRLDGWRDQPLAPALPAPRVPGRVHLTVVR